MRRYYKRQQSSGSLEWVSYYEYDGRWVSRHLDVCPQIVIAYSEGERSEAPVDLMDPRWEISPLEFAEAWTHYSTLPHGTRRTDHPIMRRDFDGHIPMPPIELVTGEA